MTTNQDKPYTNEGLNRQIERTLAAKVKADAAKPQQPPNAADERTLCDWDSPAATEIIKLEQQRDELRVQLDDAMSVIVTETTARAQAERQRDELLAAAKLASKMVDYYRRAVMTGQIVGTHPGALAQGDYEVMAALDAAISRAEGRAQ